LLRKGKTSAMLSFSLLLRGGLLSIHCDNFIEQRKHGCMTPFPPQQLNTATAIAQMR
jgi:hypothetical protein